jgi:alpha-ketoglutarate-dependent taurine dioxygenase
LELHPEESDNLLEYLYRHISENHDMQVRYKWGVNDVAIWDNRATFHTATYVFCCLNICRQLEL